ARRSRVRARLQRQRVRAALPARSKHRARCGHEHEQLSGLRLELGLGHDFPGFIARKGERIMNIENLIAEANPVPAANLPSADSPQARATLARVLDATAPGEPTAGLRARGGLRPPRLRSRMGTRVALGA